MTGWTSTLPHVHAAARSAARCALLASRSCPALVAARAASAAACRFARGLAVELGREGVVVVSGLARGIGGAQQPGYSINQLNQAMRTIWKPLIESRELQWSDLFEHYLWCVKHLIREENGVMKQDCPPKTLIRRRIR